MESVECAECSTRYDSDQNPFCPRCGSTRQGGPLPGAIAVAARNDPRRRRVRIAGIVLMAFGGLFLSQAAIGLFLLADGASAQSAAFLADQPGGRIRIVLDPPAEGTYEVRTLDGETLANGTLAGGRAEHVSAEHAAVNVSVRAGNASWSRLALVPAGDAVTVRFAADGPPGHQAEPAEGRLLVALQRWGLGVFLALSLLMVAGGVAAFRLRSRGLALAGAVVGALLALLATVGFPVLGLLFALPIGYALVAILRGRSQFASAPSPPR